MNLREKLKVFVVNNQIVVLVVNPFFHKIFLDKYGKRNLKDKFQIIN
jgi:hypothetical protein